jgi:hypothetical protein
MIKDLKDMTKLTLVEVAMKLHEVIDAVNKLEENAKDDHLTISGLCIDQEKFRDRIDRLENHRHFYINTEGVVTFNDMTSAPVYDKTETVEPDGKSCETCEHEYKQNRNPFCSECEDETLSNWKSLDNKALLQAVKEAYKWAKNGTMYKNTIYKNRFENFLEDMGECPDTYEIDRINSLGNYEPSNCRWVSKGHNLTNRTRWGKKERPRGVYYRKGKKKERFFASIRIDGKNCHLGAFDTAEEAEKVFLREYKKLWGELPPEYRRSV